MSPPRVLHVVEYLHHGAIENWLVRMLRHARRTGVDVDWTFYCIHAQPGTLDRETAALHARMVQSPVPLGRQASFMRAFRAELARNAYDVLHCHHDLVSAVYLIAAMGVPIRRRIVHVHNADEGVPTPSVMKQWLYREPMRRVCLGLADRVIGISNHTLDTFLAGRPRRAGRDFVHYYGVDSHPFETLAADRVGFRRQLGLGADARLLLFGGRAVPEKNPLFAVDVLADLRRIEPRAVGVFAGEGALTSAVIDRARAHGLEAAIRVLGWRTDLPEIMACSDCFILPHVEDRLEGFGLAVVEAQLAGTPLMLSEGIADDPLLPAAVFRRLPLSAGPIAWAQAVADLLRSTRPDRAAALAALDRSAMQMDRALAELVGLYS